MEFKKHHRTSKAIMAMAKRQNIRMHEAGILFTEAEKLIIKERYLELGPDKILELLPNRTKETVKSMAKRLGVAKINNKGKSSSWLHEEDIAIKTYYPIGGADLCLKYLPNRTRVAILRRATQVLGLKTISKNKPKKILCIELNKIFDSIRAAATFIGVKAPTVSSVLRGLTQTAGGYHWKYIEEE